jgi:hypothetical protein
LPDKKNNQGTDQRKKGENGQQKRGKWSRKGRYRKKLTNNAAGKWEANVGFALHRCWL